MNWNPKWSRLCHILCLVRLRLGYKRGIEERMEWWQTGWGLAAEEDTEIKICVEKFLCGGGLSAPAQAGSRNNHRLTTHTFIFITLPTRGSTEQHPGRSTQVGTQAPLSSIHARGLVTNLLFMSIYWGFTQTSFTAMLWSLLCFDLLHTKSGSSSMSDGAPPSLPNTYAIYTQMFYLSNTQRINNNKYDICVFLHYHSPGCMYSQLQGHLDVFTVLLTILLLLTHFFQQLLLLSREICSAQPLESGVVIHFILKQTPMPRHNRGLTDLCLPKARALL